ncbi:MAG: ATP-binding cassette domain-containing protein [Oligoflexia bacterium]|nr:ATP-binding cassette domain-containing protein [Oligoflexia bacterium]
MRVSLKQVTKAYHQNSLVLKNLNLDLAEGGFLFVAGDSGAGKTSLLKLIVGEEFPTSGTVTCGGIRLIEGAGSSLQIRKRIGVVHQDYRLMKERTVFENVAIPLFFGRHGRSTKPLNFMGSAALRLTEEVLQSLGLSTKLLDAKVKELSGGEQQRIAIARALINKPDLLVADEPTGSLDHDHTWTVMDLFQKLNIQGMTVIVATHDRDIIRKVRKPTLHLSAGSVRVDERDGACIF